MDYNMKIYEYEKAIQLLRDKLVLLIEVYHQIMQTANTASGGAR